MNEELVISNFNLSHKSKKNSSAKKRSALLNIIDDIKSGQITDIQAMPAGNDEPTIQRIPSPLPFQKETSRDNINLDYVSFHNFNDV